MEIKNNSELVEAVRRYCERFGLRFVIDYVADMMDYMPEDTVIDAAGERPGMTIPDIYVDEDEIFAQFGFGIPPNGGRPGGYHAIEVEHIELAITSGIKFNASTGAYKGDWTESVRKKLLRERMR